MLYEIMKSIRNFFPTNISEEANYEIKEGYLNLPFMSENEYFLIEGSCRNDGVYRYPANLEDEKFYGTITKLAPPKAFLSLVAEIEEYEKNYKASPYTSESFGGYSYTKASNAQGNPITWQNAFGTRLNAWRKI